MADTWCRICEMDYIIESRYQTHMNAIHTGLDMPYACRLCHYRSSVYNDVIAHFRKVGCISVQFVAETPSASCLSLFSSGSACLFYCFSSLTLLVS